MNKYTENWQEFILKDFVELNPKESLKKGITAKKIPMELLMPFCRDITTYEISKYSGGTKFKNDDTIMARITPCLENGKRARVSILDNNEIAFGSTEYIVFRARKGISDANFVYYLVCSDLIRKPAIKSMVGSSGRQRVQTDVIENLEFHVPPLPIQKKIAAVLSALDDKIELNNKINQNLEQQAQAIFKSWFIDFEPFGGKMPDDWKIGKVSEAANNIVCGKTPPTKRADYYGNDIPFITIPDMHNNVYITKTERSLSIRGANSQANKTIPCNSICVSCIGTAGLVSLTSENSQTNQQINSILPKSNISPYFIYLQMQSLSSSIQMLGAAGSTIYNLNKSQFSDMEFLLPNLNILSKFHDRVRFHFLSILHNQRENFHLAQLRDALLPELMSGEVDVSRVK